jgi:hypothetical protein
MQQLQEKLQIEREEWQRHTLMKQECAFQEKEVTGYSVKHNVLIRANLETFKGKARKGERCRDRNGHSEARVRKQFISK